MFTTTPVVSLCCAPSPPPWIYRCPCHRIRSEHQVQMGSMPDQQSDPPCHLVSLVLCQAWPRWRPPTSCTLQPLASGLAQPGRLPKAAGGRRSAASRAFRTVWQACTAPHGDEPQQGTSLSDTRFTRVLFLEPPSQDIESFLLTLDSCSDVISPEWLPSLDFFSGVPCEIFQA